MFQDLCLWYFWNNKAEVMIICSLSHPFLPPLVSSWGSNRWNEVTRDSVCIRLLMSYTACVFHKIHNERQKQLHVSHGQEHPLLPLITSFARIPCSSFFLSFFSLLLPSWFRRSWSSRMLVGMKESKNDIKNSRSSLLLYWKQLKRLLSSRRLK